MGAFPGPGGRVGRNPFQFMKASKLIPKEGAEHREGIHGWNAALIAQARALSKEDQRRHAGVSITNRHYCTDCFCCLCAELDRGWVSFMMRSACKSCGSRMGRVESCK